MTATTELAPMPPRPVVRAIWAGHRALYAITRGRLGLRAPTPERWGMFRLRTVGRRTGRERIAILGYVEDGPNLVTKAMNGWSDPEPAWWLNLLAQPEATVDLVDRSLRVRGRAARPDERPRLWAAWAVHNEELDAYAARRSRETAVVVLEPLAAAAAPES